MADQRFDIVVIGGGIVGLSTAMHFTRLVPDLRLLLVEKEAGVARHATDRVAQDLLALATQAPRGGS